MGQKTLEYTTFEKAEIGDFILTLDASYAFRITKASEVMPPAERNFDTKEWTPGYMQDGKIMICYAINPSVENPKFRLGERRIDYFKHRFVKLQKETIDEFFETIRKERD